MDTIIYFYKKRDLQKPVIESVQMKGYLLVRVGLDVGENKWFSHVFTPTAVAGATAAEQLSHSEHSLKVRLQEFLERRRRKTIQSQQRKQLQKISELVRKEIQDLLMDLGRCVDDRYECRCVYADAVHNCLLLSEDGTTTRWLPLVWQQCFPFPEFDAYLQPQWMEPLLENARLHHYVVLGFSESASAVILRCVHRMKSLRWFLKERDCGQEIQDFIEDFYEEYGLAVTMQPLEGERVFSRLLLETMEPVCVLDFTGEPRIPADGLARNSVWLDFCSIEEKGRRITERGEGIFYFSLKEIWKLTPKGKMSIIR